MSRSIYCLVWFRRAMKHRHRHASPLLSVTSAIRSIWIKKKARKILCFHVNIFVRKNFGNRIAGFVEKRKKDRINELYKLLDSIYFCKSFSMLLFFFFFFKFIYSWINISFFQLFKRWIVYGAAYVTTERLLSTYFSFVSCFRFASIHQSFVVFFAGKQCNKMVSR